MNPRNTVILVVLVAALLGFIFFVEPSLRPPPAGPVKVLPALRPASVTSVQLFLAGQKIIVERTNDGWQFIDPLVYPAQSSAIETLVRTAALLTPQTRISAQELQGRLTVNQEFGFDNPQATLVFRQGASEYTLKLGALTPPGDQIYAQVVGLAEIDIIDADFFKKLVPHQLNDWRDTSFVNLTNVNFDRITGSQPFELYRENTNGVWRMIRPVQTRADGPKIESLLQVLQDMRVSRFVTDSPKTDLEPLGLQPPALELNFLRGTNNILSLQFGKSPTNDANQVYARRNGQSAIVLLPREVVTAWSAGFQEFRDQHLVRFNGGAPDVIEIFGQEQVTVERQSTNVWRVIKPLDLPVDTNIMQTFLDTLANLQAVRFNTQVAVDDAVLPDSPLWGLAKPVRRYVLKRHSDIGISNGVMAELDFGSSSNNNIFVRRADRPEESSVYAVKLSDFAKLPATAFQLRTRRIWDFSETNVTQITLQQHGQTQRWAHKGLGVWTNMMGFMPDPLMIEVGAQELGFLSASEWIERGDQNRARYGITDQSLQISADVKVGGKTETFTVYWGGVSPNHSRYCMARMEDGLNWIFELEPGLLDRLTSYFKIQENPGP